MQGLRARGLDGGQIREFCGRDSAYNLGRRCRDYSIHVYTHADVTSLFNLMDRVKRRGRRTPVHRALNSRRGLYHCSSTVLVYNIIVYGRRRTRMRSICTLGLRRRINCSELLDRAYPWCYVFGLARLLQHYPDVLVVFFIKNV